ncbi:MAG: D-glycerate dehydrogenase [Pseudomonadota bacterium]
MSKPAIATSRKLPDGLVAGLSDFDLRQPASEAEAGIEGLLKRADGCAVVFGTAFDDLDAAFFERAPASVKLVASYGVGVDHIDLAAAKAKGVMISNTPDVSTPCLADTTMGLVIAAMRNFRKGLDTARTGVGRGLLDVGDWGLRVSGKTLGIVGMGSVGKAVAKRAAGFDMEVVHHTRTPSKALEEETGSAHLALDDLLARADIVSLHCPLTPQTERMIDAAAIAKMKQGATLINIARGALVDETALLEALDAGKLFAAGLDVFETEPGEIRKDLRDHPKVFCLPHIASTTFESRIQMAERLIENIKGYVETGEPRDRVV